MRRAFAAAALLVVALAAAYALLPGGRHLSASEVLQTRLEQSALAAPGQLQGDVCWLEDCAIGIKLVPAPLVPENFPRLLAGEAPGSAPVTASLFECGPGGGKLLLNLLEARGAKLQGTVDYTILPRVLGRDLPAKSTALVLASGASALVVDWKLENRSFALQLQSDSSGAQLLNRREQLLRDMIVLPGAEAGSISPLLIDGRYACVLKGWSRSGARFHRQVDKGWLGMHLFQVSLSEFADVRALQQDLEARLDKAGYRRSAGSRPQVAGADAFLGEYFGSDGFVQRILYARLDGAFLVGLVQGPEAARADITSHAEQLAASVVRVDLAPPPEAWGAYFGRVRNIRCLAWQEGDRVLWGAFFDDGRQQPVPWRQEGIEWSIQLTQGSQVMEERAGQAASSREFNPLVDAEPRAIRLRKPLPGDAELILTIGGQKTSVRINLK
ncbi:MAG: hypothetical protein IPP14_09215 [Planctomycetes bacterium]|nr:hypothetical protein [Planctomycetota bacterium]